MPRYPHTVVHGGSYPAEATYTFDNPQKALDHAGAASLNEDYAQALAMEQHRISNEYQRLHYELALGRMRREEAHDRAKVQQEQQLDAILEAAIPKLRAIDPSDPEAFQKRSAIYKDYPQIFHTQEGIREVEHLEGMSERAVEKLAKVTAAGETKAKKDALDSEWKTAAPKLAAIKPDAPDAIEQYLKLQSDHPLLFASDHQASTVMGAKMKYATALSDKALKTAEAAKPKPTDPMKMATQVRSQTGAYHRQLDDAQKTIEHLAKDATKTDPIHSTGIFPDEKGVRRFGFADVKDGNSPQVTPELEEKYNAYRSAVARRADLQGKVQSGNDRLDQILSGDIPTEGPKTGGPAPANPAPSTGATGVADAAPVAAVPDLPPEATQELPDAADAANQQASVNPIIAPPSAPVVAPVVVPNVGAQAAPVASPAVDPRIELANKALNDPAASEAHRSAARKILGIPDGQ